MHVKKLMVSYEFSTEIHMSRTATNDPLRTTQETRGNTPRKGRQRLPRGCHAGGTRPNATWAAAARAATSATTTRPAPVAPRHGQPPLDRPKMDRQRRRLLIATAADCGAPGGGSPAGGMGKRAGSAKAARGPREGDYKRKSEGGRE